MFERSPTLPKRKSAFHPPVAVSRLHAVCVEMVDRAALPPRSSARAHLRAGAPTRRADADPAARRQRGAAPPAARRARGGHGGAPLNTTVRLGGGSRSERLTVSPYLVMYVVLRNLAAGCSSSASTRTRHRGDRRGTEEQLTRRNIVERESRPKHPSTPSSSSPSAACQYPLLYREVLKAMPHEGGSHPARRSQRGGRGPRAASTSATELLPRRPTCRRCSRSGRDQRRAAARGGPGPRRQVCARRARAS